MKKLLLITLLLLAMVVPGVMAATGGHEIESLTWAGIDTDRVGKDNNGYPNGALDGHFRLIVRSIGSAGLDSVAVYTSTEQGQPTGEFAWHSSDRKYWVLGVADSQDGQLNHSHVDSLGTIASRAELELFCNDAGYFKPGSYFLVEIRFTDRAIVKQVIKL